MLERFFSRVKENAQNAASGPVLIVAYGDSVTQGCMAADMFDFQGVYHQLLKRMLEEHFPRTTFSVINAGVGGESSSGGLQRIGRDVICHQPDLLLLAFGLNDAWTGLTGLPVFLTNINEIILRTQKETNAEIVVLTPNFMASESNTRVAPQHVQYMDTIINTQKEGVLKAYSQALKETATKFSLPIADVYAQWERLQDNGANTTAFLSNGLNHPDRERHKLVAKTIMDLFLSCERVS